MKVGIYYSKIIIALFVITNCSSWRQKDQISISLYYRDIGCNNNYCTYYDNIKIVNYTNRVIAYKQLVDIAMKYMDTVKTDLPVSGIRFYGEFPNTKLPPGISKNYWQHVVYSVASLHFNNSLPPNQSKGVSCLKVESVYLWEKGNIVLKLPHDSLAILNPLLDNKSE